MLWNESRLASRSWKKIAIPSHHAWTLTLKHGHLTLKHRHNTSIPSRCDIRTIPTLTLARTHLHLVSQTWIKSYPKCLQNLKKFFQIDKQVMFSSVLVVFDFFWNSSASSNFTLTNRQSCQSPTSAARRSLFRAGFFLAQCILLFLTFSYKKVASETQRQS